MLSSYVLNMTQVFFFFSIFYTEILKTLYVGICALSSTACQTLKTIPLGLLMFMDYNYYLIFWSISSIAWGTFHS